MTLHYTTGDATAPQGPGQKVIAHVCNDNGGWGKGFVLAVSKRWKEPERRYRAWHAGADDQPFGLGEVQFVEVESGLWIANMIGQHGTRPKGGNPPVRYEAIEAGLRRIAEFAKQQGASVHMPRIGCGLAGGKWEQIEPIIERTLVAAGLGVTVYDFS
ncbi:MAG: macro domain-containing protein [Pirellulaceae bacterium]